MPNQNDNNENTKKEKSFLETVREIDEEERQRELAEEREREEAARRQEEEERRSYEDKLHREQIELMKLKQGLISEDDIPKEEKIEKQYTLAEKIENFIYHSKTALIIGTAAVLFVGYIVYDIATKVHPDLTILYINNDPYMEQRMNDSAALISPYCDDFNGDGKVIVEMYYIPGINDDTSSAFNMQVAEANRTKLVAEFQSGDSIIVIGDEETYKTLDIMDNEVLVDMREVFPGDENSCQYGYKLSGTTFREKLGYDGLDDEKLFISLRKPRETFGGISIDKMQEKYDQALDVLTKYLSDEKK